MRRPSHSLDTLISLPKNTHLIHDAGLAEFDDAQPTLDHVRIRDRAEIVAIGVRDDAGLFVAVDFVPALFDHVLVDDAVD